MTLIENCDVEKLISAVQCRRPIYDNSAKEHGSRGLLEHLWNEIADEMNAPVNKCKAKWQQLRNSFVRSYRGTSGYGKKRKKWYLHDALSFMEEHIQLQKLDDVTYSDDRALEEYEVDGKTNIPSATFQETAPTYSSPYYQHSSRTTPVVVDSLQKSHDDGSLHDCETHQDIPMPPKLQPMPQMQSIPPKYIVNIPNPAANTTTMSSLEENPLLNFCKGILPEFDRLSVERQRRFKTEILICLNRHLDEQEKDKITPDSGGLLPKKIYQKDEELCSRFKAE